MILLNYQKEYANLYGIDMWAEDNETAAELEAYIKDLTVSQLAEVYTLNIIGAEQEITLSEEEKEEAAAAAAQYLAGLSEAELEYLDLSESEAVSLFEHYLLANQVYEALTQMVDTEVSDDEARVMELEQIIVSDSDTAAELLERLESGSDFSTLASSYSESDTVSIEVDRTYYEEDIIEVLFALSDGEYSEILEIDGSYLLFYCTDSYDEELTEENKSKVLETRTEEMVTATYETYAEELNSELKDSVWDEVSIDTSLELSGATFFEVYAEYFEE